MDRDGERTADAEGLHVLDDGARVRIRHLLPTDRQELAQRYTELSPEGRRLRFFNAPDHLSDRHLDHLLDVDGDDRVALVAVFVDEPDSPGVGIARYVRASDEPAAAEAAVTVLDRYQRRGIGTLLLRCLAVEARRHGITTFTANVMWDNRDVLDALREVGAEVRPSEPGVATVRVAIPDEPRDHPRTALERTLRTFADRLGERIGLRFER